MKIQRRVATTSNKSLKFFKVVRVYCNKRGNNKRLLVLKGKKLKSPFPRFNLFLGNYQLKSLCEFYGHFQVPYCYINDIHIKSPLHFFLAFFG